MEDVPATVAARQDRGLKELARRDSFQASRSRLFAGARGQWSAGDSQSPSELPEPVHNRHRQLEAMVIKSVAGGPSVLRHPLRACCLGGDHLLLHPGAVSPLRPDEEQGAVGNGGEVGAHLEGADFILFQPSSQGFRRCAVKGNDALRPGLHDAGPPGRIGETRARAGPVSSVQEDDADCGVTASGLSGDKAADTVSEENYTTWINPILGRHGGITDKRNSRLAVGGGVRQ